MAETSIEWTQHVWNPIVGCSVVSPGCTNCYAMRMAAWLEKMLPPHRHGPATVPNHYSALTQPSKAGPVWTGRVTIAPDEVLTKPLRRRKSTMYFVNSMSDLFHEAVPDDWIDRVFAVMSLCPQHTFQVLTKRSARMRAYLDAACGRVADAVQPMRTDDNRVVGPLPHLDPGTRWWPLPNVWLGVSVEDKARADERIPDLLATPAAVRFVSAEPLLGPVRLDRIAEHADTFEDCGGHPDPHWPLDTHDWTWLDGLRGHYDAEARSPKGERVGDIDVGLRHEGGKLDWVIVGGESGPNARPMHPDWARSLRDQCQAAGVPFFFKQWGEWAPDTGPLADGDPIMDGRARCAVWGDGNWTFYNSVYEPPIGPLDALEWVYRLGKARAGALLDGREWREMPGHG